MAKLNLAPINWKLAVNRKLVGKSLPTRRVTGKKLEPIKPYLIQVNTPICMAILSNATAQSNWWLAGHAQAYLQSGAFVKRSRIAVEQWRIGLERAILLDFSKHRSTTSNYVVEFNFAQWHKEMQLEVWTYKGNLADAYDESIKQVIADLARLEKKVNDISEFGRS